MPSFKKKKSIPSRRFDINQTLVNTSYQPDRVISPEVRSDAEAIAAPDATSKERRLTWKIRLIILFLVALSPLIFIAAWDGRNISNASQKMFGSGNLVSLINAQQLKENNDERVNVLMVGYSADDPSHDGATLTDSIMVLSLDTSEPKGYMLSIPRDLYVSIPGYGQAKINEAFQAGGPDLLKQTIQDTYDVPIHYHVVTNYTAVQETVDALDGVTVRIASEDPRGLYDPNFLSKEGGALQLANGTHAIDGQTALKLTRARGATFGSYGFARADFTRSIHQRQVISAIKEKIGWKFILDPRVNEKFFDAVAANVKTDVKASEILTLYRLFNRVPNGDLKSISLHDLNGINYYSGYQTRFGQAAVVPANGIDDFSEIQRAIKELNQQN